MRKRRCHNMIILTISLFLTILEAKKSNENELIILPKKIGMKSYGDEFKILCRLPLKEPKEVPEKVSMKWLKMDPATGAQTSIPESGRVSYKLYKRAIELHFKEFRPEDAGTYQCWSITSSGVLILDKEIPFTERMRFLDCPTRQTPIAGSDAEIKCIVKSDFPLEIMWERSNFPLTRNDERGYRFNTDRSSLIIPGYEPSVDDGEYVVQITVLQLGGESYWRYIQLIGQRPPKINMKVWSDNLLKSIGSKFAIRCSATGHPKPTITWFRDGTELRNLTRLTLFPDFGVLEFVTFLEEDTGLYKCIAENYAGTDTATVFIDKKGKESRLNETKVDATGDGSNIRETGGREPLIIEVKGGGRVVTRSDVTLSCMFGGDEPKQGFWVFNDSAFLESSNDGSQADRFQVVETELSPEGDGKSEGWMWKDLSLIIRNVSLEDVGNYTCQVNNSVGEASFTVELFPVLHSAITRTSSAKDRNVVLGTDIELLCEVEMNPAPQWTWETGLFNISEQNEPKFIIQVSEDGLRTSLTVANATQGDFVDYRCVANNGFAYHEHHFEVTRLRIPPKPDVSFTTLEGFTSIEIRNEEAFHNSYPSNVSFSYIAAVDNQTEPWANVSVPWSSESVYNLTNLKRDQIYIVDVAVLNEAGSSPANRILGVSTDENGYRITLSEVKFDPDTSIHCYDTKCEVKWGPPEKSELPTSGYALEWRRMGDSTSLGTNETNQTSYIIDDLMPETEYELEIAAFDENGRGPETIHKFTTRHVDGEKPEYDKKEPADSGRIRTEALVLIAIIAIVIILIFVCVSCYYAGLCAGIIEPVQDRLRKMKAKKLEEKEKDIELEEAPEPTAGASVRQSQADEEVEEAENEKLLEKPEDQPKSTEDSKGNNDTNAEESEATLADEGGTEEQKENDKTEDKDDAQASSERPNVDSQGSVSQLADGQLADGQLADGQSADGQLADGQLTEKKEGST